MTEHIDLTADGRLDVSPFVTEAKVLHMKGLIERATRGGHDAERANIDLKESLSKSDAVFSLAHLTNIRNLPDFDKAERQWTKIAAVETVDDFEPATFSNFVADFDKLKQGVGNKGKAAVSPKVAEGGTYTYAYGYKEEAIKAAIEKRGFKFGLTLERIINDPRKTIRSIPGDMLQVALDTDEFLVFDALQTAALANKQIATGKGLDGVTIPKNPPVSAEAIRLGLSQIPLRKVNGRAVTLAAGYYVVVAAGLEEAVQDDIDRLRNIIRIERSNGLIESVPNSARLPRVRGVIGSEWISDVDNWYIVPEAGSTKRVSLIKLQLAGRTAPEVLVNNFVGIPLNRGTSSSPFDLAHFDNDTVDLKLRQFTNSAMITQDQMIWSTGKGV